MPQTGFSAIAPGVESVAAPLITGEERGAQSDIWALEVNYKPVRMLLVELTDPNTGKSSRELVWYLAYRAVVRSSSGVRESDNPEDRPIFVPEFTFVVESRGAPKPYPDRVLRFLPKRPLTSASGINTRTRSKSSRRFPN